jgi:hypothetical protein
MNIFDLFQSFPGANLAHAKKLLPPATMRTYLRQSAGQLFTVKSEKAEEAVELA